MSDHHHHHHTQNKKVLLVSFVIIASYMFVEAIGGWLTGSLALLSDAGHMFSDAFALGAALLAFKFAERPSDITRTYGYKRLETLTALLNGIALIVIAVFIFIEAIDRFINPPEIASVGMLIIAVIGLIVNLAVATYMLLHGDTHANLNMRGAYLHVIGDLLGSLGAIVAALLMLAFSWYWADPVASIIVASLVFSSGCKICGEAGNILLEGVDKQLKPAKVEEAIKGVEGVNSVHHLHLWSLSSGIHLCTCHVVVNPNLTVAQAQELIARINQSLQGYGIYHATIQVEGQIANQGEALGCEECNCGTEHEHAHDDHYGQGHEHEYEHAHEHEHSHANEHEHEHANEHEHVHEHEHAHEDEHAQEHKHSHEDAHEGENASEGEHAATKEQQAQPANTQAKE